MMVLQFIKTHLISLLCAVFASGFIAIGVLGVSSDKVVGKMTEEISRTRASQIAGLRNKPQNEKSIAAEQQRARRFEEEYTKTVAAANQVNRRDVLMPGVFPQPEKAATPYEFKEQYAKRMKVLYSDLKAGTLPTEAEIREEDQNVADLILLEEEQRAEEEEDESGRAPRVATRTPVTPRMPVAPSGRSRISSSTTGGLAPPGAGGRLSPEAGGRFGRSAETRFGPGRAPGMRTPVARSDEPKYDPVYRARVSKAKNILCYYDDQTTFHVSPFVYDSAAPPPEEMWYAQVALWVQQDVVNAIAELNKEAADQVTEGDACVEHMPVKRLVLIRVLGYATANPQNPFIGFLGGSEGLTRDHGRPAFTRRRGNEQYDVVRFVVSAVVDQRDVLQLMDRISRANFYQCLSASYEAVDLVLEMGQGYFYGTDPVVRATLEFEGYFARDVYEEKMPPTVRTLLGIDKEGD